VHLSEYVEFEIIVFPPRITRSMPQVDVVDDNAQQQQQQHRKVAIIGCGVTGALAASTLIQKYNEHKNNHTNNDRGLILHVFDQGRGGVGGRASSRCAAFPSSSHSSSTLTNSNDDETTAISSTTTSMLRWDHGANSSVLTHHAFNALLRNG
jgi:predicted NAD/FAD-dependent oxidoreductase